MSAAFLAKYPEFSEDRAPDGLINAMIAEASRQVSGSEWGARRTDAIFALAAALIAASPWGQQARLVPDDTTYRKHYEEIRAGTIPSMTVVTF